MKKKLVNIIRKTVKHELITGSIFIFLGGFASNIFSFLYNLYLVRSLSLADYATYASLTSIFILATLPSQSVLTIVTRFATDYFTRGEKKHAAQLYLQATKLVLFVGSAILVLSAVFSSSIMHFLQINSSVYVILVGIFIAVTYLGIVNTAFLQSLLYFKLLAFFAVVGSFFRLAIGALLILLGWKVYGALGALVVSGVFAFLLNVIPLKFLFSIKRTAIVLPWKELIVYSLPTALGIISLSSLTSTDIILVKHFFPPTSAALYSGISLAGKVIFYFTAPIPSVMFPLVIKRFNKGENVHSLFYLSLFLVFAASFAISIFYFIFPNFVITLFLGGRRYLQAAPFIGIFGLNLTIFSVVNVFSNFFLSLKKTTISYFVALAALLQILFISLFHQNFYQVIFISLILSLLLLIALLVYYLKEYGKRKKITETADFSNYPGL